MESTDNKYKDMKLEDVMRELEEVLKTLENGDIPLEEAFDLYHKGMIMMKECNDKIKTVEHKMLVLDTEN